MHITALLIGMVSAQNIMLISPDVLISMAIFTLPYSIFVFGVNDYHDYRSDEANSRKDTKFGQTHSRTERALLPRVSILGLVGSLVGFLYFGMQVFILAMVLSGMLYAYSAPPFRLKGRVFLDSLAGGGIYVLLISLIGYFINHGTWDSLLAAFPLGMYAVFFGGIIFHLVGVIVDYESDRRDDTSTTAVSLGLRPTLLLTSVYGISSIILMRRNLLYVALGVMLMTIVFLMYSERIRTNSRVVTLLSEIMVYGIFTAVIVATILAPNMLR